MKCLVRLTDVSMIVIIYANEKRASARTDTLS